MLLERKHCFEKRCKGKYIFDIHQIFSDIFSTFAPKLAELWKLRKLNLH
jgi:hypothetical protein